MLARGIKSLQASNAGIMTAMRDGFANMDNRFAQMEGRLDQIYDHTDGVVKLYETLDIELKVTKFVENVILLKNPHFDL